MKNRVYLDHNATTPLHPELAEQLSHWLSFDGNPSSIHWGGRGPKTLMRDARKSIASMLGCDPLELVFTSGGSEANNTVIKGVFFKNHKSGSNRNHYLLSAVEHPSVSESYEFLKDMGAEVEIIPVSQTHGIDIEDFKKRVRPDTALVSVMMANNETGTIFPVGKLAKIAHAQGALFHSDCVQALGKVPFNLKALGVDFATFSGHKFYSLKGAGLIYSKRGASYTSLIHGGGQERHRRAGTENVLAIAALGYMCQKKDLLEVKSAHVQSLRDEFERLVLNSISGVSVTAKDLARVPNTSSLIIDEIEGETLLMNLDMQGFAVSTGAACSSGNPEPSPTLLALGLKRSQAQSSLRVSFGWENTLEDVQNFVFVLQDVVQRLRSFKSDGVGRHADSNIGLS